LIFASVVGVGLTVARVKWTGNFRYLLLVWNLILAWLPLLFALAVYRRCQRGERRGWQIFSLSALWILFLPNAPCYGDCQASWWFYFFAFIKSGLCLFSGCVSSS